MTCLYDLKADDALRQCIMGIEARYEMGGIEKFSGMTLETLCALVEGHFVGLGESFNSSPSVKDFKSFLEKHPNEGVTAHGYLISPERKDYGLVIEGLEACSPNRDFRADFALAFGDADELDCELEHDTARQYCWYD